MFAFYYYKKIKRPLNPPLEHFVSATAEGEALTLALVNSEKLLLNLLQKMLPEFHVSLLF